MELLIKTMAGLEEVLAGELKELGAHDIQPITRAVRCTGDQRLLYRANLELRTALRVLVPIERFRVRHDDELYRRVKKIDWSRYMNVEDTLAIDAVTFSEVLRHSKFAALRAKDAIVDQFRERTGERPSIDVHHPKLRISLHVANQDVTLSLDSSGDSLHKRGYRTDSVTAPINEVLAAGMILLSGWDGASPFLDPMCGSGTLPIEAAAYAYRVAPQLYRADFGFLHWPDFDVALWREVRENARQAVRSEGPPIFGFDQDRKAVRISRQNALTARFDLQIQWGVSKFEKLKPPAENGLIIMNPPYDERLTNQDIEAFYQSIGDHLKQAFAGYDAWIISSNKDALKNIGLRTAAKRTLFNGPLECKFQKYELYQGSKKM